MKYKISLLILFIALSNHFVIAQNLNAYKYIIIPNKFDFLKTPDQYQLNALTKFLFEKENFITLFENERLPSELYENSCLGLHVKVIKKAIFLTTVLKIQLIDCKNEVVFISEKGSSKIKDFKRAYQKALRNAFKSIPLLNYNYSDSVKVKPKQDKNFELKREVTKKEITTKSTHLEKTDTPILYAQKNENGFQLVDNTPKIIYVILTTNKKDVYLLKNKKGILYKKNGKWFVEYYKNNKLKSKNLQVEF
ncbi:MAG: hypothetical protein L3J23_06645 [Flavobacteriaceae bacterium]|nr:hypothetical protein [Flavobacteriaceae bacterium]